MPSNLSETTVAYQARCNAYIRRALLRPSMHYRSLQDFEAMQLGYALPHEELGLIWHDDSFDASFCAWLKETQKMALESGWAYTIWSLSQNTNTSQTTFEKLVLEFLDQWGH